MPTCPGTPRRPSRRRPSGDGAKARPVEARSPALADQFGFRPGRRIVVPEQLSRKHHALDPAAVGEHGAEEVGSARARRAHPVAPEPYYAVADGGRGELAPGGDRLEAGRGHHVRLAGDVVQPGAGGVDRHGAVAEPCPHLVDPLPARALAADRGRRCPLGRGLGRGLGRSRAVVAGRAGGPPRLLPPAARRGRTRPARDRAAGRSGTPPVSWPSRRRRTGQHDCHLGCRRDDVSGVRGGTRNAGSATSSNAPSSRRGVRLRMT